MRNSIATKSINKQQGSSGFFTSRDSSLGRKQNIYYWSFITKLYWILDSEKYYYQKKTHSGLIQKW